MNPIKALFDPIEKLITEHGSATVLREHLSLLKSQASILEKENTTLKEENANLKIEITDLRQKIDDCQTINRELQSKLSKHRQVISPGIVHTFHDPDLDKIR